MHVETEDDYSHVDFQIFLSLNVRSIWDNGTHFHFVEVHLLDKFLIKHLILFHGYLIMDFIQVFDGTIPSLWHDLEIRLIRK